MHLHPIGNLRVGLTYLDDVSAETVFASVYILEIMGEKFPMVSPFHLSMMKCFAVSQDRSRDLRDLADVRVLLQKNLVQKDMVSKILDKYNVQEYSPLLFCKE